MPAHPPHQGSTSMCSPQASLDISQPVCKKRKLALVKCERCRLDKQKCLPVDRQWPTKCNRCNEKDFSCSEGKRVERKTKHNTTTVLTQSPAPKTNFESSASVSFDLRMKQWSTLLSYHKMMNMAMEQLNKLKREFTGALFDMPHSAPNLEVVLEESECGQIETFYDNLENMVSGLSAELLGSTIRSSHPSNIIVSELIGQTMPIFAWQTSCPICYDTGNQVTLQALRRTGNVCGEYLARLSRISRHLGGTKHWDHDAADLIDSELYRLCALSFEVDSVITVTLKELGLFDAMPTCSQTSLTIRPSEVNYQLYLLARAEGDCLGRTGLHQLLDSIQDAEGKFENIFRRFPQKCINDQDILGRTALHIACQKGWFGCVQELMIRGADPRLRSAYGTLPLHHAAANGSLEICKLLQLPSSKYTGYDANEADCMDRTALYYAVGSKNIDLVNLLLTSGIDPNIVSVSPESLPLTKAIEMDEKELVELLVGYGASFVHMADLWLADSAMRERLEGYLIAFGPQWEYS